MLNDFIGGGQVFLHKIRMFKQVAAKTIKIGLLGGALLGTLICLPQGRKLDKGAAFSYVKAVLALELQDFCNDFRRDLGSKGETEIRINATSKSSRGWNVPPEQVLARPVFKKAGGELKSLMHSWLFFTGVSSLALSSLVILLWWRFGFALSNPENSSEERILSGPEMRSSLKRQKKASDLYLGKMPLVKDSETRHILATGSTGSGKTNAIHNILVSAQKRGDSVIFLDQTGDMVSKYYNTTGTDILFNPFDERTTAWDFNSDCPGIIEQKHFAKLLFSFNSRKAGSSGDPFWETAAMNVFATYIKIYQPDNPDLSDKIRHLYNMSMPELQRTLQGTPAYIYLSGEAKGMAASIVSILQNTIEPLTYLPSLDKGKKGFSFKDFYKNVDSGSQRKLFLSFDPARRELTLPLIAAMLDLAITELIVQGANEQRRVWFVLDELAALKNLPGLAPLMQEGRKYGACVLAGLQSANQLFANFGQYQGSTLFGQFGTHLLFQTQELAMLKLASELGGTNTITKQQKNISFGAHEYRDGVSFNEHEREKPRLEVSLITQLNVGEVICLLPLNKQRIAKLQVPLAKVKEKQPGFLPSQPKPDGPKVERTVEVAAQEVVMPETTEAPTLASRKQLETKAKEQELGAGQSFEKD